MTQSPRGNQPWMIMGGAGIGALVLGCIICGGLSLGGASPLQPSSPLANPPSQDLAASPYPQSPTLGASETPFPLTQAPDPTPIPAPSATEQPEGPLADDFELSDTYGRTVRLTDHRGKVVLVNFWATWCYPCVAEMPAIQSRFEQFEDQGFMVLAINSEDTLQDMRSFGTDHGLTFPLLMDPGATVEFSFRVLAYPTSVFVDRNGVILFRHVGMMNEQQLDDYLAQAGIGP